MIGGLVDLGCCSGVFGLFVGLMFYSICCLWLLGVCCCLIG